MSIRIRRTTLLPGWALLTTSLGMARSAIRGGYGIFYDRMLNGIWEQNAFQDPPLVQTATINNTQFDHPLAGSSQCPLGPNHIVSTGDPTMSNPYYMDYNLGVQNSLLPNTVMEIALCGNQWAASSGRKGHQSAHARGKRGQPDGLCNGCGAVSGIFLVRCESPRIHQQL